jgi:hypothetical protein
MQKHPHLLVGWCDALLPQAHLKPAANPHMIQEPLGNQKTSE